MEENIKVRWLTDHEQTKIAPKTLVTQVYNEDGTRLHDTLDVEHQKLQGHMNNGDIHVTAEEKAAWNSIEVPSLEGKGSLCRFGAHQKLGQINGFPLKILPHLIEGGNDLLLYQLKGLGRLQQLGG